MSDKQENNIESIEEYKAFRKQQEKIKKEKSQIKKIEKKKRIQLYRHINTVSRFAYKKNSFETENKIYRQQLEEKKAIKKIDFGEKSIKDFMHVPKLVD